MFEKYFLIIIICLQISSCNKTNDQIIERIDKVTKEKVVFNYIIRDFDTVVHGKVLFYDKSGKIITKCNYNNGKLNGVYYIYYDNGKTRFIRNYHNNIKNGKSISFFNNGKIEGQKIFRNDTLCGDCIYNFNNGYVKQYVLYDSIGRVPFSIEFERNGIVKKYKGKPINCFLDTETIKIGEKFKIDCMVANIPNAHRSVEFVYSDSIMGQRKIKKASLNYLKVEELKYKKGKNMLYVIVTYKFNQKYHNQVLKDTAFIDYYVN